MNQNDYNHVLNHMRLVDGNIWPIPICLDISLQFAENIKLGQEIALRNAEGILLAVLEINDIWKIDKHKEAEAIYATKEINHPGVAYLNDHVQEFYIAGNLFAVFFPQYYDFTDLRHTPIELKKIFEQLNWKKIIGFQTRNPMHKAHQALTLEAVAQIGGNLLIHPVVGPTKSGDIDYPVRVKCYQYIMQTYPLGLAMLSLLPLAMRMAGPREALWHAIIRKNYGCTHFIIGRDHAGPGNNQSGQPYYDVHAAQQLTMQFKNEIGIEIIPFQEMVYSAKQDRYYFTNQFPADEVPATISGTELRKHLHHNLDIPEWFSYPAIIKELRYAYPAKSCQGFTIFFTGLPSSGK